MKIIVWHFAHKDTNNLLKFVFCYRLFRYVKGQVLGKNLQINNTQNKNLQKPEHSLTLENKQFTGLFLQILCVSLQLDYFPTHHRQSIEYQRSVNLIGTWLFFESFSKVSESVNA